jgi:hypothetical protein
MSASSNRALWTLIITCAMAALALALAWEAFAAGPRKLADTLTATTANMTPAGVSLRVQILEWQDAAARAEAVASIAAGVDASTPLAKLPTVGYVWQSGSPVGYSVKYAHREPSTGGGERITLVTDKRLGSYDFKGWAVAPPAVRNDLTYSVIELNVGGSETGTGRVSLAGNVQLDEKAGTVALDSGVPTLLTNVKREAPMP